MDKNSLYFATKLLITAAQFIENSEYVDLRNEILRIADSICTILENSPLDENSLNNLDKDTANYINILKESLNIESKDLPEIYEDILKDSLDINNDSFNNFNNSNVNNNSVDIRSLVPEDIINTVLEIQKEVKISLEEEKNNAG